MRKLHSDEEKGLLMQYHSINIEKLHSLLYNTLVMPLFDYCRLSATVVGGSQWGGGFYGYRLKLWLFYGYRLIFFSYG